MHQPATPIEMEQYVHRLFEAWSSGDPAAVDAHFHSDAVLRDSVNGEFCGIDAIRALLAEEMAHAFGTGWIMRTDSHDLPWHRVLGASGRPAAHLADSQLARLRAEGVPTNDGRVPLRQVRHCFG